MNESKKLYLGIKKWHDAGIRGQGITVASIEYGERTHAKMVMDILKEILPEAKLLTCIHYWRPEEIPEDLDGYTCSLEDSSSSQPEKVARAKELYDKGVFMTCSVGNSGTEKFNKLAKYDEWVSVGAVQLYDDGDIIPCGYSSVTDKIDFVSITDWDTEHGFFNGTSCSAPVLQGMAMLVQCYYKQKYGRKLSNEELYKYMKMHSKDLKEDGFDSKTGNGLFILPDMEEDMEIVLKIGDTTAYVNEKPIELDVAPFIENSRTLVPVRFIAEALGCEVEWDALTETVTIIK